MAVTLRGASCNGARPTNQSRSEIPDAEAEVGGGEAEAEGGEASGGGGSASVAAASGVAGWMPTAWQSEVREARGRCVRSGSEMHSSMAASGAEVW